MYNKIEKNNKTICKKRDISIDFRGGANLK